MCYILNKFNLYFEVNMHILSSLWNTIQRTLFPWLEEELGPLTEKQKLLVEVLEVLNPRTFMTGFDWVGNGRKPKDRLALFKGFVTKAVFNFPTTEVLVEHLKASITLRRLCGWENLWEIPSLSTFSRAFAQFAQKKTLCDILKKTIHTCYGDKIAGHVSRDSTTIEAREKPVSKDPKPLGKKYKRGRPKKGEEREPKKPKRLDIQGKRSLKENLIDLPRVCDIGTKKNSKGHSEHWIGYKLHVDAIDGDIPVSVVLTSASLNDSQVAIPLAQMTGERVANLYDLMDAAYDAEAIVQHSRSMGHVPIVDSNPRNGESLPMEPAQKARYAQRTSVERVFSMLKDNHGGKHVRVRGAEKVMTHLMFGILVITVTQLLRLLP
jgi:hypothetical protein